MREKLINIIARCNSQEVREKWIIQMATETDVECSESQCDGCIIQQDCLRVLQGGICHE